MPAHLADLPDTKVALTDAATIALDCSKGKVFTVTLGGNRVLGNPTNARVGVEYTIMAKQDGTGSRLLTYGSLWKFPGGAPTASTGANALDVIKAFWDGVNMHGIMDKAYAA
jgi:hypothetical protein